MAEKALCSIPGCAKTHHARGHCKFHYRKARPPIKPPRPLQPVKRGPKNRTGEFIAAVVSAPASSECIIWPFSADSHGYGSFRVNGKDIRAHRAVCRMAKGVPSSDALVAAHSCDNRLCVNPGHLRWATPQENTQDRQDRQRQQRGSRHYRAKLTEQDVPAIRRRLAANEDQGSVAKDFGVSPTTISMVNCRKTWKHVA